MALNLNETATLIVKAQTAEFQNELLKLNDNAKGLQKTLKEIEKDGGKGSENWKKYRQELDETRAAAKKMIGEVDASTLSYGQLENRVKQLNAELKKLKPGSQEFIDTTKKLNETKALYDKAKASIQDTTAALHKQVLEAKNSELSYGKLELKVKLLNDELRDLTPGTQAFISKSKQLQEAETHFKGVQQQVKGLQTGAEELAQPTRWQRISGGVKGVATAFQAFMALQIIGFVIGIGKAIFETTAKFEKYGKVLETALGSEKEAKESMEAIKIMAKNTAFTVDQLTEGYVKMVNRGIRPSKAEMIALTDLAASQGKEFDQLVEAALDAQTGEFERLKEFGIRASKEGDKVTLSFKGMQKVVANTPEALNGAIVAFGQMNGVAGQNAKMMETLGGQASNLEDNFDALKVELGERLRPVFSAVLTGLNFGIDVIRNLAKVIASVVSVISSYWQTLYNFSVGSMGVMKNMGGAIKEFLNGNFDAAAKAWEQTKAAGQAVVTNVKASVKAAANDVKNIWTDKGAVTNAQFAGKQQGQTFQKGLTDEQKKALKEREKEAEKARKKEIADHNKHLEDVRKANEKALEDLHKLEAEAHIAAIKDEEKREMVKLMAERDLRAEEIMRTVADENLKNQQIDFINKKLEADLTRNAAEHAEKRRKKADEEAQKRLDNEKQIIDLEKQAQNALFDWKELNAKGNATKLAGIQRERLAADLKATQDKLHAEEAAEKAKATREITDKDQLGRTLTAIEGKYHQEQVLAEKKAADEKKKIEEDLKAKRQEIRNNLSGAFASLLKGDVTSFIEHGIKLMSADKDAFKNILKDRQAAFEMAGQMAMVAAQFLADVAKRKADRAIAEIQRERDANLAALNEKVQKEQAELDKLENEKQKIKQESEDTLNSIKSISEKKISDLESQYRQLSSSEEKKKLQEQLDGYKNSAEEKTQAAKDAAEEAIDAAKDEQKQTTQAAKEAEQAAIKSATNEKNEKIDAAEATRDAEIASINKRTDVDQQTRAKLIAESKAKFETEKKQATDEAQLKIDKAKLEAKTKIELANDTAKTKIELANDTKDAELKAIKAMQDGDEKAAKEILQRSKEDQKEKIRLAKEEAKTKIDEAEKEKREKLKKVEQEAAIRKQNQKDLNAAIEAENKRAREKEVAEKQKAWKAQQKADIASALITGALATIKALASGFWPANLVFAALSAVMTGVQIAKIKSQPMPTFRHGGIPDGPRHGRRYGQDGLAIVNRRTGREEGEMEGGEAIISREQTEANRPLIERMFANARTPGKRNRPVSVSDRDALGRPSMGMSRPDGVLNGAGKMNLPMMRFGGIAGRRFDEGGYSDPAVGADAPGGLNTANADYNESKKQFQEQIKAMNEIRDAVVQQDKNMNAALNRMSMSLGVNIANMGSQVASLRGAINAVEGQGKRIEGATNGVRQAVYDTNAQGAIWGLMGAISSFGGKK